MDWMALAEIGATLFGVIGGIFGFMYRHSLQASEKAIEKIMNDHDKLATEFYHHQLYAANNYVTNSDLSHAISDVKATLENMNKSISLMSSDIRQFLIEQARLDRPKND